MLAGGALEDAEALHIVLNPVIPLFKFFAVLLLGNEKEIGGPVPRFEETIRDQRDIAIVGIIIDRLPQDLYELFLFVPRKGKEKFYGDAGHLSRCAGVVVKLRGPLGVRCRHFDFKLFDGGVKPVGADDFPDPGIPGGFRFAKRAVDEETPRTHRALDERIFRERDCRLKEFNEIRIAGDDIVRRVRFTQQLHHEVVLQPRPCELLIDGNPRVGFVFTQFENLVRIRPLNPER